MQADTEKALARQAVTPDDRARGRWQSRRVEIGAGIVLVLGALAGVALWAEWGFLIAFDAALRYCFG